MIHKMASEITGHVCVCFELPSCLWADRIYVVGDFNHWDETASPMRQDRDGVWRAQIDLLRGRSYEFRYLIDGQWTSDTHADGFVPNQYGDSNSIVHATLPMPRLPPTESHIKEILTMPQIITQISQRKRTVTYPTKRRAMA